MNPGSGGLHILLVYPLNLANSPVVRYALIRTYGCVLLNTSEEGPQMSLEASDENDEVATLLAIDGA
jgi:hypothetical protein